MENKLELRMYGLVPYNISSIQQGIQFGHAVVEYGQKMKRLGEHKQSLNLQYDDWADNWKTFIILNGGTTNYKTSIEDGLPFGTLNNHTLSLLENGIEFATFSEPDLGDQLTAVVFIVDERVFNRKKYPDFEDWLVENYGSLLYTDLSNPVIIEKKIINSEDPTERKIYDSWKRFVGGDKNVFLRDFLKNFRLA